MGIKSCIVQYYIWIRGLLLWPVYELYIIEWFSHSLPLVEAYLIHPVAAGFSFMMVVTLASEGFLSKYYIQMAIHKLKIKLINLWTMLMQFQNIFCTSYSIYRCVFVYNGSKFIRRTFSYIPLRQLIYNAN